MMVLYIFKRMRLVKIAKVDDKRINEVVVKVVESIFLWDKIFLSYFIVWYDVFIKVYGVAKEVMFMVIFLSIFVFFGLSKL